MFDQFGAQLTVFSQKWSLIGENLRTNVKISDFDPKIVKNIFEIICILTAAKKYTNNLTGLKRHSVFILMKENYRYINSSNTKYS